MTEAEQRNAATQFYNDWRGLGNEKSDCQKFWIEFCSKVLGIDNILQKLDFEKRVIIDGQTKFIDVYIPETRVLIEQKSFDKPLDRKYPQSDGSMMTPFEQARNYAHWMIPDESPLWIIVCNFQTFEIRNMNKPTETPIVILLDEVRNKYFLFDFMFKKDVKEISYEKDISLKAGDIVGVLYDKLLAQYREINEQSLKSLNALCVRLVFCLYAEDAGIFGRHMMFHDYLKDVPANEMRRTLRELFKILDMSEEERNNDADYKYLADDNPKLAEFPYVNGGLFADETIEIPPFNEEIKDLLLNQASAGFDWKDISPTIFGAVFESTLNPNTRRSGGMHYTSIENIHKVIDSLFLGDLRLELSEIKSIAVKQSKTKRLRSFQKKIAGLYFLDPACGSGNFLTETYISLRRLENEVIRELQEGQIVIGEAINPIQVSIKQFYGIEINDFAVTVAKTALWIAESQMMKETEDIVHMNLDFLPLKSYANIVESDSLEKDWNEVIASSDVSYVMGNPPFIGARLMEQDSKQKLQVEKVFEKIKDVQDLDYVTCWFKKAAEYMQRSKAETGFVATNSICQGSQVPILWNVLLNDYHVHINFAHQTFRWDSESSDVAAVHCVIIGFSAKERKEKKLYSYRKIDGDAEVQTVAHINPYLFAGEDVFVTAQKEAICDVPKMNFGNQPRDGGHFILSEEEYQEILKQEPGIAKWIHPYMGADEFIKGKKRYCIWLKKAQPSDIQASRILYSKVAAVREFRLESKAKTTNGYAKVPQLFAQITQPDDTDWLIVPSVSSERRRYVPIGFMTGDVISSNAVQIVPNATLYHFGILTSNVHMAWMRMVCGRLEMRYRYSKELVYNTFPWPQISEELKEKVEKTAQAILDARALFPTSTMAALYDPNLMPIELSKAHAENDRAVMRAYGFMKTENGKKRWLTEQECVVELMRRYQNMLEMIVEA